MGRKLFSVVVLLCVISIGALAQSQQLFDSSWSLPDKIFNSIDRKASQIEKKIDRQTEKYLTKLERQTNRLRKKLSGRDSALAKELFAKPEVKYDSLKNIPTGLNQYQSVYSGHLDSLSTAFNFLKNEYPEKFLSNPEFQKVSGEMKTLQEKFSRSTQIETYIKGRQLFLKQQFENLGMVKQYKKFEKQVYYYKAQMEEYKNAFEDPSKLETRLLTVATNLPAFKKFFANNSMLAGLFPNMGPITTSSSATAFGLQTRSILNQYLNTRFAGSTNYNQVISQNIQSAQGQLDELRNKLLSLRSGGIGTKDLDIPDFKPNEEKTKSFFKRLEFGTNMQTTHASGWFPITSDLGLSVGYKLNDKNVIGLGASYKMGWGQDIHHIDISNQGAGFRSFADFNIKKNFFLSGGLEYNYQKPLLSVQQIYSLNEWQQSGLVGVSKIVTLKTKFFKKTKIQLLWDFLSYRQRPQTQAIKFRVGYNF